MRAGQARAHRDESAEQELAGCTTYLALHTAYLDGDLDAAAREAHTAHAAACASCARYARVLSRGLSIVRDIEEIEPSAHFEERLRHRIFHIEDEARLSRGNSRTLAGIAAAALLTLIAWSPFLWRAVQGEATEVAAGPGAFAPYNAAWYAQPAAAELDRTTVNRLVSYTGSYSPLIVNPPAYGRGPRAVRFVSATTQ